MLDNKLEGYLKDIRKRIAIIFYDAMSVEFNENELKKKRGCGAIKENKSKDFVAESFEEELRGAKKSLIKP